MKSLTNKAKTLIALASAFLLLAGGYSTALASGSSSDEGCCAQCCEGASRHEMMQKCPMMEDGAMVGQMTENCPMMKGMMHGEQDTPVNGSPSADQLQAHQWSATADRQASAEGEVQVVKVTIGSKGYEPARIEIKAGVPAQLIFIRTTDATCATQIQAPELGIEKTDLPLNKPVTVEFTPEENGAFTFACGMNMIKGTIVVKT